MSIKTKAKTSRSLLTPSVPEAGEIASVKDKRLQDHPIDQPAPSVSVALLTGGTDKDYAFGLASALGAQGVFMDFIASDEVDAADLRDDRIRSLNLRGSLERDASMTQKGLRVLKYYFKLIGYAARAQPKIFHILWNNKFLFFDRTVLMLYYKLLGKKVAFTAHNVNAGKRDGNDSVLNRLSLKVQYRLSDHIFVHTEKMKREMMMDFAVPDAKVTVIPYGLYNTLPNTTLTVAEAKEALGMPPSAKILLFFGNIAPYKGIEYLVEAFVQVARKDADYRLVIVGATNNCEGYWGQIHQAIAQSGATGRILQKSEYVPDDQVEIYFKAADVCVLPYTHIYQSGVLFLAYSFGLPVIATDVGSLGEEIIEGKTGFLCKPRDASALVTAIETYFCSDLFRELPARRPFIRDFAVEGHSWTRVGTITRNVYSSLAHGGAERG